MATSKNEKAQETETPAESLMSIEDFLLQLEAAEILKAGFRRLVHGAGYKDSTRTFTDWEVYFKSFLENRVH